MSTMKATFVTRPGASHARNIIREDSGLDHLDRLVLHTFGMLADEPDDPTTPISALEVANAAALDVAVTAHVLDHLADAGHLEVGTHDWYSLPAWVRVPAGA